MSQFEFLSVALSFVLFYILVIAAAAVRTRQPAVRAATTVLYGICLGAYLWIFAPRSY